MSVQSVIDDQQAFARDSANSASSLLSKIENLVSSYFFVNPIPLVTDGSAVDNTPAVIGLLHSLFPADLATTELTAAAVPTFTGSTISDIGDITVPDFNGTAPQLIIPQPPAATLPNVPAEPSIAPPTMPSVPTLTFPTAPEITGITFPDVPGVEIPVFTSALPIAALVVPTNSFTFYEELYASANLDALQAKLLSDMANGGYGIETSDEAALWDRARSRELEGAMAEAETLIAEAAARGFPLPPGDMNVALQRANQKLQDKMSTVSRDIALKRADLYVENRKFTIEQTRQLEQILIGFHNSIMERTLNAAKATMEVAISVYNAQVAGFNVQLESYKTEAAVFESRVRGELARVEIYRAQMEGKRIEADVQRAMVEVYTAQLAGVNAVISLYKSQVEAVRAVVDVDRLRVETFRALIDAYGAQVQAKTAEFGMFKSRIDGEVARVTAFEAEARAYSATVSGLQAKASIAESRLRAQVAASNQVTEAYKAQITGYTAGIGAQAQVIDANARIYGAKVQGGSAKAAAVVSAKSLYATEKDAELRRALINANINIENAKVVAEGLAKSADAQVRAAAAGAGYYQALVGAAVNSINTLTSLTATSLTATE